MGVRTRISSASNINYGLQIRDLKGNILVSVKAVNPETWLDLEFSESVVVVKSNGVKFKRKR